MLDNEGKNKLIFSVLNSNKEYILNFSSCTNR